MPEPPADAGDDAPEQGSNSLLLTITGPFLNFLAMHKLENPGEQRKLENPGKLEALKMTFWPFAVAGGFLFGLGIAGGNAFMSGKIEQGAAR